MAKKKQEKNQDREALNQLKRQLSQGSLGNLYVFYGEEAYLRDNYLGKMKETLLTGGLDDFNFHTLTAGDYSAARLQEYVNALPMMSERTLVLVTDVDIFKKDMEELCQVLSDLPDYLCLIFLYDVTPFKMDGRTKLGKLLKEKAQVVEFARQEQGDLVSWIGRRFKALDREISAEDARYLIFLCGDLMTGLAAEIGKIGTYAKERRVTRADIDAVAIPQLDAVVFQLTDAVSAGNFDRAFSVLSDLMQMGEVPVLVLSVLGKQVRQLYTAKLAQQGGRDTRFLMETWGMKYSYPAEKLMTAARKFSLNWCRRAVLLCGDCDYAMKSTGTDGKELLTRLLLDLAARD